MPKARTIAFFLRHAADDSELLEYPASSATLHPMRLAETSLTKLKDVLHSRTMFWYAERILKSQLSSDGESQHQRTVPPGRSPGRPKGARNRLAARVFEDIFAHWCEPAAPGGNMCKGQEALETLYKEKPGEYLRLTASVLPKEFVFENVVADLDDDQIDDLLMALRQRMVETRAAALPLPDEALN
jgi:hypothetical protein